MDFTSFLGLPSRSLAALFVCGAILTAASFYFKRKIIPNTSENFVKTVASLSFLNGAICSTVLPFALGYVSPSLIVFGAGAVLTAEFMFFSRAPQLLQIYVFIKELIVLSCATSFTMMAINFSGLWDLIYAHPLGARMICAAVMIGASAMLILIASSAALPIKAIVDLIKTPNRRSVVFLYVILCAISVLTTVHFFTSVLPAGCDSLSSYRLLGLVAIKDLITLISSFMILLAHTRSDGKTKLDEILLGQMSRKREFLRLAHGRVIASFGVNCTKSFISEGAECFAGGLPPMTDYRSALRTFVERCVNPDDEDQFEEILEPDFLTQRIAEHPTFSKRFRVSREMILRYMKLPPDTVRKFESTTKQWLHVATNCIIVQEPTTDDMLIFIYLLDIDEDIDQYEDMRHSATFDGLTGVCNRRSLEELIKHALAGGSPRGALFIMDLDNFKSVNDTLGHPAGDKLLVETAEMLKSEFRSADIVGRLGGDEFMVCSIGMAKPEMIKRKAERLNDLARRDIPTKDGRPIRVSFSIGVSLFPEDGMDYSSLYKRADAALYISKLNGKDRCTLFDATNEEHLKAEKSKA